MGTGWDGTRRSNSWNAEDLLQLNNQSPVLLRHVTEKKNIKQKSLIISKE